MLMQGLSLTAVVIHAHPHLHAIEESTILVLLLLEGGENQIILVVRCTMCELVG